MALQASPQPVQTSSMPADAFAIDSAASRRHHHYIPPSAPMAGHHSSGHHSNGHHSNGSHSNGMAAEGSHSPSSPASSRRPSRRTSTGPAAGAAMPAAQTSSPQTPHHHGHHGSAQRSPNPPLSNPSSTSTARGPTSASAAPAHSRTNSALASPSPSSPPPPPRSSSQTHQPQSNPQLETALTDRTRPRQEGQISSSRDERAAAAAAPPQQSTRNTQPPRPTEISRENSEVLNRVVVTDPEVDLARERERMAEAVPQQPRASAENNDSDRGTPKSANVPRSRQDFSASAAKRKETKFGDYILGQTLGEGEFGKVKLGWKKDGSVQVAIKLIKRENLKGHPSRLPKIYREVTILSGLSHPNIVRLHEMVETERYIGIILEYASGGELFDYILNHRYLKDPAARKLFAQLVSGVGYLHKKGIVHRDLKLENLLLDRHRNIIITDFGFANTFDPSDELGEDIEYRISNKDFVQQMDLDRVRNGVRRGDLMQTSCGSPCYAAPELVVSDSLYTGRKVDVWSCGVILYAMLAGYLPFDDDPANPEGDNINLLYKYIVSTPLTFPDYVTPHARDLLRRILVPDPRKRADLFEVARHSWLSEYAHVVAHVTSNTTSIGDITSDSTAQPDNGDVPLLSRSASVREPTKPHSTIITPAPFNSRPSTLVPANAGISNDPKAHRDAKRRTVQVEYVAPSSETVRGEVHVPPPGVPRSPGEDTRRSTRNRNSPDVRKPLPPGPIEDEEVEAAPEASIGHYRIVPPSGKPQAPSRPSRDPPRSVSDSTGAFGHLPAAASVAGGKGPVTRPVTGNSLSAGGPGHVRLPSRGNSYSQPLAPAVAPTNAQGRLAQPKGPRNYNISDPIPQEPDSVASNLQPPRESRRPLSQRLPSGFTVPGLRAEGRGHRRSNTLTNVLSKPAAVFGGSRTPSGAQPSNPSPLSPGAPPGERSEKRYPPTSMRAPIANAESSSRRQSTDSRRQSFGFSKRSSENINKLDAPMSTSEKRSSRRFSLLPASFSLRNFTGSGRDDSSRSYLGSGEEGDQDRFDTDSSGNAGAPAPPPAGRRGHSRSASTGFQRGSPSLSSPLNADRRASSHLRPPPGGFGKAFYSAEPTPTTTAGFGQTSPDPEGVGHGVRSRYSPGFNEGDTNASYADQGIATSGGLGVNASGASSRSRNSFQQARVSAGRLHKPNRRFADAWDQSGPDGPGQHAGSSGAAKRVMDFFRRRGKGFGDDR